MSLIDEAAIKGYMGDRSGWVRQQTLGVCDTLLQEPGIGGHADRVRKCPFKIAYRQPTDRGDVGYVDRISQPPVDEAFCKNFLPWRELWLSTPSSTFGSWLFRTSANHLSCLGSTESQTDPGVHARFATTAPLRLQRQLDDAPWDRRPPHLVSTRSISHRNRPRGCQLGRNSIIPNLQTPERPATRP